MPLETTMICIDNSEWMRNGDYTPTRFEAQHDAANMLCGTKTQQNPESTVGFVAMAGKGPEVKVSPTEDMGKLLGCLPDIQISGTTNFVNAMQVAQLALKHRKNKKGQQRIVAFVGSPLTETQKELENAGKKLKKNNIAVDVVLFGEIEENNEKLEKFVEKVNSSSNSHLVVVPAGILPSDALASSPIIHGDDDSGAAASVGGGGGGGGGGGNFEQFGGVNPDLDPELAMALRVSMEEEKARQERATAASADGAPAEEKPAESGDSASADAPAAAAAATPADATAAAGGDDGDVPMAEEEDEESALLAKALAMSTAGAGGDDMDDEADEVLQLALQMSMQPEEPASAPAPAPAAAPVTPASAPAPAAAPAAPVAAAGSGADVQAAFLDPSFVTQLLEGLPGVDPNDPKIKAAMDSIASGSGKKEDNKDKKDDDKK